MKRKFTRVSKQPDVAKFIARVEDQIAESSNNDLCGYVLVVNFNRETKRWKMTLTVTDWLS